MAPGRSVGSRRSAASCSGCSSRVSMPLATRFRVVSPPALISSRKKRSNSRSLSRSPSISAASSTLAMSSAGARALRSRGAPRRRPASPRPPRAGPRGRRRCASLGQLVEAPAVVDRDAHQLGDQRRGQLARHLGDEVAAARRRHRGDDPLGELADPRLEARHLARREAAIHEGAQLRVRRRVHVQQHHAVHREPGRVEVRRHHAAREGREGRGSRDTRTTSACRESSQKPGPSRSGCQHTGASARSRWNTSWGGPPRKVSGSRRSISRSMAPP